MATLKNSPYLTERAKTNINKVAEFRSEVLEECKEVQERIHIIR